MQRANGGSHRADNVGIAAELAHSTAAQRLGSVFASSTMAMAQEPIQWCSVSRADDLIELFAGRFDAVGVADMFSASSRRAISEALNVVIRAVCA